MRFRFRSSTSAPIEGEAALSILYSAADVTLVPSLEETFSNTAAESIACGTPVVGFATGALPELAANGRGITVPVGDDAALAKALAASLLSHWDAQSCRQYMAENHSYAKIGGLYHDLFADLIRQTGQKRRIGAENGAARSSPAALTAKYLASRLDHARRSPGDGQEDARLLPQTKVPALSAFIAPCWPDFDADALQQLSEAFKNRTDLHDRFNLLSGSGRLGFLLWLAHHGRREDIKLSQSTWDTVFGVLFREWKRDLTNGHFRNIHAAIWFSRPDLQKAFAIASITGQRDILAWFEAFGRNEYHTIPPVIPARQ